MRVRSIAATEFSGGFPRKPVQPPAHCPERVTLYLDIHQSIEVMRTLADMAREAGGFMKRLEGKVAVVTGGNSGIGLATAERFLDEGARVAISGRNEKTLSEAVKLLGKDVVAVKADTARLDEIRK